MGTLPILASASPGREVGPPHPLDPEAPGGCGNPAAAWPSAPLRSPWWQSEGDTIHFLMPVAWAARTGGEGTEELCDGFPHSRPLLLNKQSFV